MTIILDGNKLSQEIRSEIRLNLANFQLSKTNPPKLSVILVGEDPASSVYVRNKERACTSAGILTETLNIPADVSEEYLINQIKELNQNIQVNGILVQLPLPPHISETTVISAISPSKDVDGIHPYNLGKLAQGEPIFVPCTPLGIQQILVRHNISIPGKHVVVCGRSNIVGKPIANLLMQRGSDANATVTVCHSQTRNLQLLTSNADILIAAIGQPNFITEDMVKEDVSIIDVGINRIPDSSKKNGYRLVGDVDFINVEKKAHAITPVPGGVGPMTITMLLNNTVKSWIIQNNLSGDVT
jgi:methylenetetrahydrofolate dehydrogenase (NADP+) / methenyltetrahydrofolate cyclohydrolase